MSTSASPRTSLLALVCALVLLGAACGGDDSGGEATTETTSAGGATTTTVVAGEGPSDSPAATLRSDLTALLEEQVYLTGFTVEEALDEGSDLESPRPAAAAEAASESATELSEVVGTVYGVAAGADFVEVWNDHREAILAYALDGGSAGAVDSARDAVVENLTTLEPEVSVGSLSGGLGVSDEELLTTIDAMVADEPGAAADLRLAADEMPDVAQSLAQAFAAHGVLEGEVDGEESELRAELTGLLQASAYQTGLAMTEIVKAEGNLSSPAVERLNEALDENTADLGATLEPGDTEAFVELWSEHIGLLEGYAAATFAGDARGIQDAEDQLAAFRDQLGSLLSTSYPVFTPEAVAEELVPHVETLLAFADSLAPQSEVDESSSSAVVEQPGTLLREAGQVMRLTARTLAGGITTVV